MRHDKFDKVDFSCDGRLEKDLSNGDGRRHLILHLVNKF